MKVKIHDNYAATKDFKILGYMGEINAREITVEYPQLSDADTYRLRFEYSDGVVYDVPLQDGKMIVTASLIRETGEIKCQWLATKSIDGDYELVAKSQVFRLEIESSIGDEVSPVPAPEVSTDALAQMNEIISTAQNYSAEASEFAAEAQNCVTNINSRFTKKECYLLREDFTEDGYYSIGTDTQGNKLLNHNTTNTNYKTTVVSLKAGTYTFRSVKGIFTVYEDVDGNLGRLADEDVTFNGTVTFDTDVTLYATIGAATTYNDVALVDGEAIPDNLTEKGVFELNVNADNVEELKQNVSDLNDKVNSTHTVNVKTDGTGDFTSLVEAVNSITDSSVENQYNVYIYDNHDIIDEMGGDTFLASIDNSSSARSGLVLPDGVNLIGVGDNITLSGIIPDDSQYATYNVSKAFAPIELYQSNTLENLTVVSRNARYAIHDESNGAYTGYKRVMKNVKVIHQGNIDGIWSSVRAVGSGGGPGAEFYFENCEFTTVKGAGYSIHDNTKCSKPMNMRFENCVFNGQGKTTVACVGFSTVSDSSVLHEVIMNNCTFNGMVFQYTEGSGSGNAFNVRGGGNTKCLHMTNGYDIRQGVRFDDEVTYLTNTGETAISKGQAVKVTSDGCALATNNLQFYGIALEDIAIGETGAIQHSGMISARDVNISFTADKGYGVNSDGVLTANDSDYVAVGVNYLAGVMKK